MASHQDDLDLLLSLQDKVPDTPPGSPPPRHLPFSFSGCLLDDGSPKRARKTDMSVFREAVKDFLVDEPIPAVSALKSKQTEHSKSPQFEKFSGLRIKNQLVSATELSNHFSEIRFVQLQAIRNLLMGDTISGSWATVGVLCEKGSPKMSSTEKPFCVWKLGCLTELNISVFLFGDAYTNYSAEPIGTIFAFFNSNVRKDAKGNGFSLSVYSASQMMKLGISADYGICRGTKADGTACTMTINKRSGAYCMYHNSKVAKKYTTSRPELKAGNLRTAFMPQHDYLKSQGIYLFNPLKDGKNPTKPSQPAKVLSVDGLKKVLSNAGQCATIQHSQGIRFLREVAGQTPSKDPSKTIHRPPNTQVPQKRVFAAPKLARGTAAANKHSEAKRIKMQPQPVSDNLIELDIVTSDEEC